MGWRRHVGLVEERRVTRGIDDVLNLDGTNSSCGSGARRTAALNAGAVGVIFVDVIYLNLGATGTSWSMLRSDWNNIEAAMTPGVSTAAIGITASSFPAVGDLVAGFSFRGPRSPNFFIDVGAPVNATVLGQLAVTTLRHVYAIAHPGMLQYFAFGDGGTAIKFPTLALKNERK